MEKQKLFFCYFGEEEPPKPEKPLAEKDTLVSVLTLFVISLLVCKHTDCFTSNNAIPFRNAFSSRKNQENNFLSDACWICAAGFLAKRGFSFFRLKSQKGLMMFLRDLTMSLLKSQVIQMQHQRRSLNLKKGFFWFWLIGTQYL